MIVRTGKQVGTVWMAALALFAACVIAARALNDAGHVKAQYWIGDVGLLAIAAAIVMTGLWLRVAGPRSRVARGTIELFLVIGSLLWLIAMAFPFL